MGPFRFPTSHWFHYVREDLSCYSTCMIPFSSLFHKIIRAKCNKSYSNNCSNIAMMKLPKLDVWPVSSVPMRSLKMLVSWCIKCSISKERGKYMPDIGNPRTWFFLLLIKCVLYARFWIPLFARNICQHCCHVIKFSKNADWKWMYNIHLMNFLINLLFPLK